MSNDVLLRRDFLSEEDFNLIKEWVSNKKNAVKYPKTYKSKLCKLKELNNPLKILCPAKS